MPDYLLFKTIVFKDCEHEYMNNKIQITGSLRMTSCNTNFLTRFVFFLYLFARIFKFNESASLQVFCRKYCLIFKILICVNITSRACRVTRFGIFYYQIRLGALRQHSLLYIIAMLRAGGTVRPDLSSFGNK